MAMVARAVRDRDAGPEGRGGSPAPARSTVPAAAAALLLVLGITVGSLAQGGFYGAGRVPLALAVLAAVVLALVAQPPARADCARGLVVSVAGLAALAIVRGWRTDDPSSGIGLALLVCGFAGAALVGRRLASDLRALVLQALLGVGLLLAATGWIGVVWHREPWGLRNDGVWRAASSLTYANATAAVLVPLSLVALALLTRVPRSVRLALVTTVLLVGAAATMSRAGYLAMAAGSATLLVLCGPRRVLGAAAAPALGALVSVAGLVPVLPRDSAAGGPVQAVALVAGLGTAALLTIRPPRLTRRSTPALAVLAGLLLALGLVAGASALSDVAEFRASVKSTARADAASAAVQVVADHPLLGVGPADGWLRWNTADGANVTMRYVHDEYLQTAVELGLTGLVLLLACLVAAGRLVRDALRRPESRALACGVAAAGVALLVHGAFDFVWHVPVVPLIFATSLGLLWVPDGARPRPATAAVNLTRGDRP